jgi:hypothetical protein
MPRRRYGVVLLSSRISPDEVGLYHCKERAKSVTAAKSLIVKRFAGCDGLPGVSTVKFPISLLK